MAFRILSVGGTTMSMQLCYYSIPQNILGFSPILASVVEKTVEILFALSWQSTLATPLVCYTSNTSLPYEASPTRSADRLWLSNKQFLNLHFLTGEVRGQATALPTYFSQGKLCNLHGEIFSIYLSNCSAVENDCANNIQSSKFLARFDQFIYR